MQRAARLALTFLLVGPMASVLGASCGLSETGLEEPAVDAGSGAPPDATSPPTDAPALTDHAAPDVASGPESGVLDAAFDVGAPDTSFDAGPTDAPVDTGPTCTACGPNMCCNAGSCTNSGDRACGDPGQACVDCASAMAGTKCITLNGHQVCGCAGPGNSDQCSPNMACHNNQCGAACDGQHPCNGGCCSGNDLANSVCIAACAQGAKCQGNYCQ
jgi:hypothetical protein